MHLMHIQYRQNNKFVATTLISASHVLFILEAVHFITFFSIYTAQINLIEMPSVFYSVRRKQFHTQRVYQIKYLLMLGINIKPLNTIYSRPLSNDGEI